MKTFPFAITWSLALAVGVAATGCKKSSSSDNGNGTRVEPTGGNTGDPGNSGSTGNAGNTSNGSAGSPGEPTPADAGSGSGGSPTQQTYPEQIEIESCAELGERSCERLQACAPFLTQAYYGDETTCVDVLTGICEGLDTPPVFTRCADSLEGCGTIVQSVGVPAWCWTPPGTASLGGACLRDTDCAQGLCQQGKEDATGSCTEPAGEGEACADPVDCAVGLRCAAPGYTCVRPVANDAACASPFECEFGSTCDEETLKCARTEVGGQCVNVVFPCNTGLGQYCSFDACQQGTIVNADDSCLKAGTNCGGTERCNIRQVSSFEKVGECRATVRYGEACDAEIPCIEPLSCRDGSCAP